MIEQAKFRGISVSRGPFPLTDENQTSNLKKNIFSVHFLVAIDHSHGVSHTKKRKTQANHTDYGVRTLSQKSVFQKLSC